MEKFPSTFGVTVSPVWPRLVFCCFHGPRKGARHKTNLLRQSTGQPRKLPAKRQVVSARPRLWNTVECSLGLYEHSAGGLQCTHVPREPEQL